MGRRWKYLLLAAAAVAVVVGVGVGVPRPAREPEYGGRRLSQWVVILSKSDVVLGKPDEAVNALRHVGSNAVPYLVRWIRYEPHPWRRTIAATVNPLLRRLKLRWSIDVSKYDSRTQGAIRAFSALGLEAEAGIPDLCRLMNDRAATNAAGRATSVLMGLRTQFVSADMALIKDHDDKRLRLERINWIYLWGSDASRAVPGVIQCLQDNDEEVALAAARQLALLHCEACYVLPALVIGLQDRRPEIRLASVERLRWFSDEARSAEPDLMRLLNDPDMRVRQVANEILSRIDPQALEKAPAQ